MKPSGKMLGVAAVVGAVAVAAAVWSMRESPAEKEVRAFVASCIQAAESKHVEVLVDAMAEDFKGPGAAPREGEKSLLTFLLQSHPELEAILNPELTVKFTDDDHADVKARLVFSKAKGKTVAELPAGAVIATYEIDGKVARVGGKWLFVSANSREL